MHNGASVHVQCVYITIYNMMGQSVAGQEFIRLSANRIIHIWKLYITQDDKHALYAKDQSNVSATCSCFHQYQCILNKHIILSIYNN